MGLENCISNVSLGDASAAGRSRSRSEKYWASEPVSTTPGGGPLCKSYPRLPCSKDHLLFQMKPVGQKDEPSGAKERPVTCPSRVGQNWGGGGSLAELGREIGPQRSGLFCGKGSSLTET